MADLVDLIATEPPADWGVVVDHAAIDALADSWASDEFLLPAFDYPGTPAHRDEAWWFDYVTLATSVLACLWPPEGDEVWHVPLDDGSLVDDAPAIFRTFTRAMNADGLDLRTFASLSDEDGRAFFAGHGTLQLVDQRTELLRRVATTIIERWDGTVRNLVDDAGRQGKGIVERLIDTMPGYLDRPETSAGVLPFDKLAHLGAAIMAAGVGWGDAGFAGYDDFPVYPDYMLPRVLRHVGVLVYSPDLADAIDARRIIPEDSPHEHALRWGTVHAGAALRGALHERGNAVTAPALDYRLWSEAVLGPDAAAFGEHHRTITMRY